MYPVFDLFGQLSYENIFLSKIFFRQRMIFFTQLSNLTMTKKKTTIHKFQMVKGSFVKTQIDAYSRISDEKQKIANNKQTHTQSTLLFLGYCLV